MAPRSFLPPSTTAALRADLVLDVVEKRDDPSAHNASPLVSIYIPRVVSAPRDQPIVMSANFSFYSLPPLEVLALFAERHQQIVAGTYRFPLSLAK